MHINRHIVIKLSAVQAFGDIFELHCEYKTQNQTFEKMSFELLEPIIEKPEREYLP